MPFGADTPPLDTPTPELGHPEIIAADSRVVACDGGSDTLGHPRVWLQIVHRQTFCPYCSRIYVLNPGADDDRGH